MGKFIEIISKGSPVLINLDWVEMVNRSEDGTATIYFAFTVPNGCEQDYILTDESYERIADLIWRKGC